MVDYVPTNVQAVDIFMKVLGPFKHYQCMELLGLKNSYKQEEEGFSEYAAKWRVFT